ncbi:MAG TPA: Sec-independent protein translocase protein TatB [Acidimicrobiales bacterium]|nr:Sec-independent protein translocase protein TatB [Acidimicrobiales bacterium]
MFNVGAGEMFVIMLLALIVLGPERLPRAMGQVGRAVAQLRRMSSGFQDEIRRAMDPDDAPFRPGEETLRGPVPGIEDEVKVVNAGEEAGDGEPAPGAEPEPEGDRADAETAGDEAATDDTVTPLRPRRDGDARATG